jgi:hypothetical protein
MRAVERLGAVVQFACERWPRAALLAVFLSPLWLNVGLQLWRHLNT